MRDEQHQENCCVFQGLEEQPCKSILMDAGDGPCPKLLQPGERGHAPPVVLLVGSGVQGNGAASV